MLAITVPLIGAGAYFPWIPWVAFAWFLLTLSLFIADWLLTPGADGWRVTRIRENRFALAAWNLVEIQISRIGGTRPLSVQLRDLPPPTFRLEEETPILHARIPPGETRSLSYRIWPPRRGDYSFGDIYLRWRSVLGFLERSGRYPAQERVQVYPNLEEIRKYDLMLRRSRLTELGLRNSRLRGAGSEYERLRDYQPDDEYRSIHWLATARRGRPVTIEYQTERSQTIVSMLDVGRMMRSPVGAIAKMDYAIQAVLLLTYVAAQKGDRVGLLTFADEVQQWLKPAGGARQFRQMLSTLYAVQGQAVEPRFQSAFSYLSSRQRRRALVILFTDLTGSVTNESLMAGMVRLRRTHLPLLVTLRDPTIEALARMPIGDSNTLHRRTVAGTLLDERELMLERLRQQGVLTLDVSADQLSIALVNRYLEIKARSSI